MDRHAIAMLIPIIVLGSIGLITFTLTPLGRAIARRIGGQAGSSDLEERVSRLEVDLDATRHELAESQERLDFTERALTQLKDAPRLPPGPS